MNFDGLEIAYDDTVLEPRPWTLEQSRWAVALLADLPAGPVLELCAGAGQIGLVVGRDAGRHLVQVDAHDRACHFARRNADRAGLSTDVRCIDLEEAVAPGERFPFVLADPPYVPSHRRDDHPDDPHHTIDGGEDGLDLARACLGVARRHLVPEGLVLIQLYGPDQAAHLSEEAVGYGLEPVETRTHGADRSLLLLRPVDGVSG